MTRCSTAGQILSRSSSSGCNATKRTTSSLSIPKGIAHTEYQHKVDGFCALFEYQQGQPRAFQYDGLKVRVRLWLVTQDIHRLPQGYQRFWIDRVEKVAAG